MVSVFVSARPLSRVSLTLVITHPITRRMILKYILCFMIHFTTRNSIRIYSVPLDLHLVAGFVDLSPCKLYQVP